MLELKTSRVTVVFNSILPLALVLLFFILALIVGYHCKDELASSTKSGAEIWYAILLLILALLLAALSLPGLYVISHAIRAVRAAPIRVTMSDSAVVDGRTDGSVVIERSSVEDVRVRRGIVVIEHIVDGALKTIELHRMSLRDSAFKRFIASVRTDLKTR